MTTEQVDLVLRALADIRADLAELKTQLGEVKVEARLTNGRLRAVELWRAGLDAVSKAHAWVRPSLVGFVSGVGLLLVGYWFQTR